MIISIHQPNYIPWIGFFNKILSSDVYVVFDDVQFPRGKDYANRNQIKTNNGKKWLTVPVIGKSQLRPWNEIEINNNGWANQHLLLLESFYKKSEYFTEYYPELKNIYLKGHSKLIDLNLDIIKYILKKLDSETRIVMSSDIKTNKQGMDKIFHILKELNATTYISGNGEGSKRYIDEKSFEENDIELIWQNYTQIKYKQQHGEFISYMTILDLLFNHGPKSKKYII
tara:strand:- start:4451 stop:5131 length:681 start_codon:yes stop_codon:yes gene_type:complete